MLYQVGKDIVTGLWNGISSLGGWLYEKVSDFVTDKLMRPWTIIPGVNSPAKELIKIGRFVVEGAAIGLESRGRMLERASTGMAQVMVDAFEVDPKEMTNPIREAVSLATSAMMDMDGMDSHPVIRPVVDLSNVKSGSKAINGLLNTNATYKGALALSSLFNDNQTATAQAAGPAEIKYEQNINAPTALSTADIYRQTRSLIAITKEEANIP